MTKQQTPNVVPFGKYKGQPVEVLTQDKPYLDWLAAQDWFRERYNGIYTLIVNNFSEASETPDHNALQVLFLDDDFCERFVTVLRGHRWWVRQLQKLTDAVREIVQTKNIKTDCIKCESVFMREFEKGGVDVSLNGSICVVADEKFFPHGFRCFETVAEVNLVSTSIEIKPTVR